MHAIGIKPNISKQKNLLLIFKARILREVRCKRLVHTHMHLQRHQKSPPRYDGIHQITAWNHQVQSQVREHGVGCLDLLNLEIVYIVWGLLTHEKKWMKVTKFWWGFTSPTTPTLCTSLIFHKMLILKGARQWRICVPHNVKQFISKHKIETITTNN
jgi:hypothetical protein